MISEKDGHTSINPSRDNWAPEPSMDKEGNADTQPWEAQMGWLYIGHGEWIQTDNTSIADIEDSSVEHEPDWIKRWLATNDPDISRHEQVLKQGYPNRWGAQVEVVTSWNLELMASLLQDYDDKEVVEWLRYGWPTGRLPTLPPPSISTINHKGATDYPEQLERCIKKEKSYGAVLGPFGKIPFSGKVAQFQTQEGLNRQEGHPGLQFSCGQLCK